MDRKCVAYLLAVQTALVSLDADILLTTDGEAIGKRVGGRGEGRGQGVDVLLGELLCPCVSYGRQRRGISNIDDMKRGSRTVKDPEAASRPEKSAARTPALVN